MRSRWRRAWQTGPSARELAVLTALALILRLVVAWALDAFETPSGRWEHGYEVGAVAVALGTGRGFADPFLSETGPTAGVGPALPALWSLAVRLFGPWSAGAWACFVVGNVLFSTALVPLTWRLGRRCGGERVGLVAAIAWALHPVGVLGPVAYQAASGLFALSVAWSLERLVALEDAAAAANSLRRPALGLGLALGTSLWVEPLLLPVFGGWLLFTLARRRRRLARAGGLAAVVAALIVTPWLVRNLLVFDQPVFLRSWAGPELLLGAVAGPGEPTPVQLHPSRSPTEMRRLQQLGEPAYAAEKLRQARARIAEQPGRWGLSCAWRWAVFWVGRASWWTAASHPVLGGPVSAARGAVHVLPAVLGFAGLLAARRRRRGAVRVLALTFLLYPVTYALTHVEARYRLPIEPAVVVAAALLIAPRDGA